MKEGRREGGRESQAMATTIYTGEFKDTTIIFFEVKPQMDALRVPLVSR